MNHFTSFCNHLGIIFLLENVICIFYSISVIYFELTGDTLIKSIGSLIF